MLIGKHFTKRSSAIKGYAYIGLLLMITITGIGMAAAGMSWHYKIRSEKEQQLLFVGKQFNQALLSYYESSPTDIKEYPRNLQDLVLDNRFPKIKRHIRQLYSDPMSDSSEWGLVRQGQRIIGVYSLSKEKPFKLAGFAPDQQSFSSASTYRDWIFGQPGALIISDQISPITTDTKTTFQLK